VRKAGWGMIHVCVCAFKMRCLAEVSLGTGMGGGDWVARDVMMAFRLFLLASFLCYASLRIAISLVLLSTQSILGISPPLV